MIVTVGHRRVSVLEDEPTASFAVSRVLTESIRSESDPRVGGPFRSTVEILRRGSGLMPRALVGGLFTPGNDHLVLEVGVSGDGIDGVPTCTSQLWHPLVSGLPGDFATAVVHGLVRTSLPAGRLTVDRAAFDPVESSPSAFELAAELLAVVLATRVSGGELERAVRRKVEAWP